MMNALRANYGSLTPREREVMTLVASGLLNKQVGGARYQRDHGEGAPRPGDAKNEGRLTARACPHGRPAWLVGSRRGLILSVGGERRVRREECRRLPVKDS